ncbi:MULTISPECIES: ABC transporter permease [unclassified Vibrio]|uniref:ABC transporter permease n=1 Tax=unclassified Vibrio TaxID=2614977 RepID=UPI001361984A|nr:MULTISPECIES: ABC transporter permease [unclassified Vibrio]NAW56566.1 FtsX-like permease family protein [Vibrio sp. V36_P2S2PM302]NAX27681.1 FtsX-like permease family protein [Vibrio sp. V38_P2S17PM301]NAX29345.1 FtsX-like permease family protein [Vibrio sp. V37_P2S8PM304]
MINVLQQTGQTLTAHRMKSALAVIAISWGVISVVVLMALGEGFYRQQSAAFALLTNSTQIVAPSQTGKPWQGFAARRTIQISAEQANRLMQTGYVSKLALMYEQWDAAVTNGKGQTLTSNVGGTDDAYLSLAQLTLKPGGRRFTPSDLNNHTRVAIVGNQIAQMGKLTVGDRIKVKGIPFYIIGVLSDENSGISFGDQRRVLIPITTYLDIWNDKPGLLLVKPAQEINGPLLRQNLLRYFAGQLHFDPSDTDAIHLPDLSDGADVINGILRGIQLFLAASGAMTMAVGALGVANIMFLSVTERTREIGVRLAIGATQNSVMIQFLAEGLTLVVVGTLTGLLVAAGTVHLLVQLSLPDWMGTPVITLGSIGVSMLVTVALALMASYFPARRASRLTPVVALSARV